MPMKVLAAASLAFLTACAPAVAPRPPPAVEPLSPRSPAAEQAPKLTLAERVAIRDGVATPDQQRPRTSPAVPATGDYPEGFPRFNPPPKARADGSLQSFIVLDTGGYQANNNVHNLTWTNDSGRSLAIYKAYVWTGVDKGAIADLHIDARRSSDGSYIAILQWDHYADPTVPQHGQQFDYPIPMIIDPGEKIEFKHVANGFLPGWHAQHLVILWIK